jgi:hypothetical protein
LFRARNSKPKRNGKPRWSGRSRNAWPRNACRMRSNVSRSSRRTLKRARKPWPPRRMRQRRRLPRNRLRPCPTPLSRREPKRARRRVPKRDPNNDRLLPTECFIGNWNRTARGAKRLTMVTSGNRARRKNHATGVRTQRAVGSIAMRVGPGFPTSLSAGRLTIMDAGSGCAGSVGFGYREMNGRRPGCRGERAKIMSAGRRCRRKRASIAAVASMRGRTAITISVPTSMHLFRTTNLATNMSGGR